MAERTKIWIADKMKELMKTKPLEKIRVTEICRVAGGEVLLSLFKAKSTSYFRAVFRKSPIFLSETSMLSSLDADFTCNCL